MTQSLSILQETISVMGVGREREEVGDRGLEGELESIQKKESVGVVT